MEKSRYVRVIEVEEVRKDKLIKYFLPIGVRSTFWVQEGWMAIEVPQNEEISGGGINVGKKGIGSAVSWRRANRGSINIKEWERGGVA